MMVFVTARSGICSRLRVVDQTKVVLDCWLLKVLQYVCVCVCMEAIGFRQGGGDLRFEAREYQREEGYLIGE